MSVSVLGEGKTTKEPRITVILTSIDRLRASVTALKGKVEILVGSEPPDNIHSDSIEPITLKDLLNHLPGWLKEIENDIEYNTNRLGENLQ